MKDGLRGRLNSYTDIENQLHVCWCLCFEVILHPRSSCEDQSLVALKGGSKTFIFFSIQHGGQLESNQLQWNNFHG